MPTLKQSLGSLPTLKELKAQFTDLTGIPANKANVYTVCSSLGDRKMVCKADWDFAISNIIPEKTLKYQQQVTESLKDLITALESQTDKLLQLNTAYEDEFITIQEENDQLKSIIAEASESDSGKAATSLQKEIDYLHCQLEGSNSLLLDLQTQNEKLKASADAFKQSNLLYHEDFHNQLDEIEQLKAENERLKAMDQDADELIARLRDEIKFLNGELAKAMKKPMREIQLEKRVQDLEDEVYDLQRELRKVRNTETASLNSIPTIKAFADFCFALPLEWVGVFVRSYLANSSDLKATYRELSRKFHPDTNHSIKSADLFRTLRDSYEVLKDARQSEVTVTYQEDVVF